LSVSKDFALILKVFLLGSIDPDFLGLFQLGEFVSVVGGFFNAVVDCHHLLVVLQLLESTGWLDLSHFNWAVQFGHESVHLDLVLDLQFIHVFVLLLLHLVVLDLPLRIEFQHQLFPYFHVIHELSLLDVGSQFVLVADYFCLQEADFTHEVLVERVLVYLGAFVSYYLHLLLDQGEKFNLFVFVQKAVATVVKNFHKFFRRIQPQQIENLPFAGLENEGHVDFIEEAFIPKISLANGVPDLLALLGATDHGFGLLD